MNSQSFELLRKVSYGKFSYAKFAKLKKLAKNTIGCSSEIDETLFVLTINLYQSIDEAITGVESKIIEIMEKLDSPTASIPGIGMMSAAMIIAEYWDVSRFANDGQMLAYAGLDCGRYQSCTSDFPRRMVKHGSGYLRQALMNVAEACMTHVPSFYDYYLKKRNEGKSHRVALSHIARKLVRLIYKLETNKIRFDLSVFNSQHQ